MINNILEIDNCTGCGACVDKCPYNAIKLRVEKTGSRLPAVDSKKCVSCGLCKKTCPNLNTMATQLYEDKSFIGFYKNKEIADQSSSGGVFAAVAKHFLEKHAVVYGAAMVYENDRLNCKHIRIDDVDDLRLLQGSKYVQSHTEGIFNEVKRDLDNGRLVLFSGTSCQIAGLRSFIGNNENLFLIDLVCHGVPKDRVFADYVDYVEALYNCKLVNMSFRAKGETYAGVEMPYFIKMEFKKGDNVSFEVAAPKPKSSYYNLFLARAGYRESCYVCKYATIKKPSDITLGDFRPNGEELIKYGLDDRLSYSSIIVHNDKGYELLKSISEWCFALEIPVVEMLKHHLNMQKPSETSNAGILMYQLYLNGGFAKLHRYVKRNYLKANLVRRVKKAFRVRV